MPSASPQSNSRSTTSWPRSRNSAAVELTPPSCSASGLTPGSGSPTEIAIRRRPGAVAAASVSEGPPSAIASVKRAASATVRVSGPYTVMPRCGSTSGAVGTRPRCVLSPKSPQQAAGMRIEPAPSVPSAAEHMPAATAVAEPPDEPPDVRCGSHGLRVTPNVGDSVNAVAISSGTWVLPRITAPAARSRLTTSASAGGRLRIGVAAVGGDLAGDVDVVLDRDRHAEQRPHVARAAAAVRLVGGGERLLAEHDAERVQQRVEPGDPRQEELHQFARGDLAGGDQVGVAGEAGEGEVVAVHSAADLTPPARMSVR